MMAKCDDRSCRYSLPRYQIGRFRRDLAAGLALCAVGTNLLDCAGGRMNSALRSIQRADARWGNVKHRVLELPCPEGGLDRELWCWLRAGVETEIADECAAIGAA